MKVALCIPWYGAVKAPFAFCLFALGRETKADLLLFNCRSSCLPSSRNKLAADALASDADYLLWLDTDQTFPPDALDRLLGHDKAFVAANYPRRLAPDIRPTASHGSDYAHTNAAIARDRPLEPVESVGLGFALIHRSVFEAVPHPRFNIEMIGDGSLHFSEDRYFCRAARAAGFQIYVDQVLSLGVGHYADVERKFPQ